MRKVNEITLDLIKDLLKRTELKQQTVICFIGKFKISLN